MQNSGISNWNSRQCAQGVVWNLDELYSGADDPEIEKDLKTANERGLDFIASYKGKLLQRPVNPSFILSALRDYESIHDIGKRPCLFAYLYHAEDTADPKRNRLLQKVEEEWNNIWEFIAFFELEIMTLPDDLQKELASNPNISDYRHFFFSQMRRKPFALSEAEEQIIKKKDISGRRAFISLFDSTIQSVSCRAPTDGEELKLNAEEALALLYSPDPLIRENVFSSFLLELERHGTLFTQILNALTLDYHLEDRMRGHGDPMERMHLTNGVDGSVVERMLSSVEGHYDLARRYFRLKARLLGMDTLKYTDLFAPLEKEESFVNFSDARRLFLEAVEDLHPLCHSMARGLFEKRRINAEVKRGKQLGSFCKCLSPCQPPYVSMNYRGTIRDLVELAHELGHGIHYMLSARRSFINFRIPPILAETASTFFEILLSRHLMKKEEFLSRQKAIAACRMDRILLTVFRQNVMTRFEQSLHSLRKEGPVDAEDISRLWLDENRKLLGEDVQMPFHYRWGWAYIPHIVHRPFYCYSYVFGNLLSVILYKAYMEQGEGFLEGIIALFSAGSSRAPLELLADIGLYPDEQAFWERACQCVTSWIDALDGRKE